MNDFCQLSVEGSLKYCARNIYDECRKVTCFGIVHDEDTSNNAKLNADSLGKAAPMRVYQFVLFYPLMTGNFEMTEIKFADGAKECLKEFIKTLDEPSKRHNSEIFQYLKYIPKQFEAFNT